MNEPTRVEFIPATTENVLAALMENEAAIDRSLGLRCPRCDSPSPNLHPAVQHEGEVQICPDPWHGGAS